MIWYRKLFHLMTLRTCSHLLETTLYNSKNKDEHASIPVSSIKINKQIAGYRQQKHQKFDISVSEISNYITYGGKHLKNSCSGVNKNDVNNNDNSCNTLQKLRFNNPLRIIVGQLNINSARSKFDTLFSVFKQKIYTLFGF